MAPYLADKKGLTVYTYGTELCDILSSIGITVYCLGGCYNRISHTLTGEYALTMAQGIYFDAFFFSASAYSDETVSDYNEDEAHLRRAVFKNSQKKYFLCDSEKLGKRSAYILCRKDEITDIITEQGLTH